MQYGTVTGRFLSADGDPLSGEVRFTPDASAVLVGGLNPATVLPAYVDGVLDNDGYLCEPDVLTDGVLNTGATRGVSLVIPETGVTNPVSWTYRVTPQLRDGDQYVSYRAWSVEVTSTGVDLTTAAPVPSSSGTPITRGEPGVGVPEAGLTGQHLVKLSDADYDTGWVTTSAGGEDLSAYVTETELSTALVPYVTDTELSAALGPYALDTDLAGYTTDAELTTALAGKADTTHTHGWTEITGKPATYPAEAHTHLWADITDKPATFTPSAHTHTTAEVTGLDAALSAKANQADVVLTVNGTAPDDTGNVTVEGGGGGAVQDTGTRSLPLMSGWKFIGSTSTIKIRRIGNTVIIYVSGIEPTADSQLWTPVFELPAGFKPPFVFPATVIPGNTQTAPKLFNAYEASSPIAYVRAQPPLVVGEVYFVAFSYSTVDPWPTVLPGTPA